MILDIREKKMNLKQMVLSAVLAVSAGCAGSQINSPVNNMVNILHMNKNIFNAALPEDSFELLANSWGDCFWGEQNHLTARIYIDNGCDASVDILKEYVISKRGIVSELSFSILWRTDSYDGEEFKNADQKIQELMEKYGMTERLKMWKEKVNEYQ